MRWKFARYARDVYAIAAGLIGCMAAVTMTPDIAIPVPGIYPDVPAETYHSWKLPSNSWFSKLATEPTPAHVWYLWNNPAPRTPSLILGDAFHLLTLQPELFAKQYTCAGPCEGVTKGGKPCSFNGSIERGGHWYCKTHDPGETAGPVGQRTCLSAEDYERVHRMRDRVMGHPLAGELLRSAGPVETSVVFKDPDTGLLIKSRLDKLLTDRRIIVDLKTSESGDVADFAWSVYKYGYHRQGALYEEALAAHGQKYDAFLFLTVEKDGPYEPAVRGLDDAAKEIGREELRELKRRWKQCAESGVWPGYSAGVEIVSLPDSVWQRMSRES